MQKLSIRRRVFKQLKDLTNWLDTKSHTEFEGSDLGAGVLGLTSRRLSVDTFFTVYRSHGDVFAVVRELSENTGAEGFRWINDSDSKKDPDIQMVKAAEFALNSNRTFKRWKRQLIQTAQVAGNAYILIERGAGTGKVIGLSFIDPRTMSVVTDKHGTVLRWIQKVKGITQEYRAEDIAHFFLQKDPNSPVFGLSPLEPIFWEVRTDQSAMISNFVFFENDAVPAAHYIMDEDLTDEEQKRAVEALKKQIKGADKRHKSMVVKGLKDIKTLSVTAKDMEFHVLRKFTTEKVCAAYGVPKSILNYTEAVNRSTAEEQTKKFWQGTILPLEELVAEFINVTLLPKMGIQNIKIAFNPKRFENQQWNEASTRADLSAGILTINEVRVIRGLEEFDVSKEGEFVNKPMIYQGVSVVPVEDVGVALDDIANINTEDAAVEQIKKIREMSERHLYGRKTDGENNK